MLSHCQRLMVLIEAAGKGSTSTLMESLPDLTKKQVQSALYRLREMKKVVRVGSVFVDNGLNSKPEGVYAPIEDEEMKGLLPKSISGIPKLDINGFDEQGIIRFVPQLGSNYIMVYRHKVPYRTVGRKHIGNVNLQGGN